MKALSLQLADQDDISGPSMLGAEFTDYCSQDGAESLKAMIEAYWLARGQHVMVSLQNVGFHPAIRAARFDLRSDMVNGQPRGVARCRVAIAEAFCAGDAAE